MTVPDMLKARVHPPLLSRARPRDALFGVHPSFKTPNPKRGSLSRAFLLILFSVQLCDRALRQESSKFVRQAV